VPDENKVAQEAIAECVADFLTNFVPGLVSLDYRLLKYFFSEQFSEINGSIFLLPATACFSYLFNASTILFFLELSFITVLIIFVEKKNDKMSNYDVVIKQ